MLHRYARSEARRRAKFHYGSERRKPSHMTASAKKSWSRTEWHIRKSRLSPGWRRRIRLRFERLKGKKHGSAELCTVLPTMPSMMRLSSPVLLRKESSYFAAQRMEKRLQSE